MNASIRKKLLWLHTWSGLTIGLVVVFLALTGGGLVLKDALEDHVYRELHVVPKCSTPLPLDRLAEAAVSAHPAAKLHSVEVWAETTSSVAVMFTDKDYVYVDPCSAQVLGTQNQYGGFFGVMDWLHRFRFFSDLPLGRTVAGWVNTTFLVLLIGGGIALWWPRNRQALKGALKFNPRLPGTARTISLHKVVGLYTALVMLVITLTGLPLGFEPVKNLIYSASGYVPPKKPLSKPAAAGAKRVPIEAFWQKTLALVPDLEWVSLRYPPKPGAAYEAEILQKGSPHSIAKGYHYMDATSGETLALKNYADDQHIGRKIYLYCIAIHAGMIWGLPYQLLLLVCALGVAVQAYSGFSPYLRRKLRRAAPSSIVVKLSSKTALSHDITRFEFVHPKAAALPAFSAGAHIDVSVPGGLTRQYSLCNDPQETHRYVIGVLRHADSRGGSIAMHQQVKEGDTLQISLPKNYFQLAPSTAKSLLFAGGIGITPILAMAQQLARSGRDFELHYCARSRERAGFVQALENSSFMARVSLHFSDSPTGGAVDFERLLASQPRDSQIYVCGPAGFMDKVVETARRLGWPAEQLHREQFAAEVKHYESDREFDVKLARSGKVVHIAKHRTVAAVLADCGVNLPVSCEQGVCGTCLTRVLDGDPEHRDSFLTAAERAAKDRFTPCCSRACGSMLVLDL